MIKLARILLRMTGPPTLPVGNRIDPCDAYTARGFECPSYVTIGTQGNADIFPLQTVRG